MLSMNYLLQCSRVVVVEVDRVLVCFFYLHVLLYVILDWLPRHVHVYRRTEDVDTAEAVPEILSIMF